MRRGWEVTKMNGVSINGMPSSPFAFFQRTAAHREVERTFGGGCDSPAAAEPGHNVDAVSRIGCAERLDEALQYASCGACAANPHIIRVGNPARARENDRDRDCDASHLARHGHGLLG